MIDTNDTQPIIDSIYIQ